MKNNVLSTIVSLAVLSCAVEHSAASLYPTQPIAKTVFEADKVQIVKWKDSDDKPSLKDTPRLRMDLYVANDQYLATLAEKVNPLDMYHNVTVSSSLWSNASNFHIRFYSRKPEMTIYTADFTITGMQGKNVTSGTEGVPGSALGNGNASNNGFGLQGNGASNVNTVTATSTMGSPPSEPTTVATSFQGGHSSSGEAALGRRFSAERGLVKYVYVLWPLLIGVALAL